MAGSTSGLDYYSYGRYIGPGQQGAPSSAGGPVAAQAPAPASSGFPADAGNVKQLPFQKSTSSTPNMSMLNPAFSAQLNNLQQAAPDYASYFTQLSNQAFEDANRQSARLSAAHGGAPTASTGNTGQNQGAYQGMLFDQLNKSNVDRMWNTQDAWETNKYNKGADAYKDYFGAIANKAYDTGESGYTSGIYNPSNSGAPFNPYANSNFPKYNDSEAAGGAGGGAGGAGGGSGTNTRPAGSIGGPPAPGSHPPGGGSWDSGYQNYPDFWNEPGYPSGPNEFANGYGGGYGGGTDEWGQPTGGGLDSYLQDIANQSAQGGGGAKPFDPRYGGNPNDYFS
jgi:hypothetical protein